MEGRPLYTRESHIPWPLLGWSFLVWFRVCAVRGRPGSVPLDRAFRVRLLKFVAEFLELDRRGCNQRFT